MEASTRVGSIAIHGRDFLVILVLALALGLNVYLTYKGYEAVALRCETAVWRTLGQFR